MISIIICSRTGVVNQNLSQNIAASIGAEYELVPVDNSKNEYSIFQAYNIGVEKAKGDILCFMHEDILFHTNDWGKIIRDIMEEPEIGVVGFAGAHFLPSSPMYWFSSPLISEHNLTNDNGKRIECFADDYYDEQGLSEVVAVDGFCFFIRKALFESIAFDENRFEGFHAYDMDICMQTVAAGYKVCVCNRILIEHFWSESALNNKEGAELFEKNLAIFTDKWKESLPIHKGVDMPDYFWERMDALCYHAHLEKKMHKSGSYRIGHAILAPLKKLKSTR